MSARGGQPVPNVQIDDLFPISSSSGQAARAAGPSPGQFVGSGFIIDATNR
jgi:hypothetical protein